MKWKWPKWPWVSRALYEQALAMSAQAWHDKQVAEDRLYAAWKEGAVVPPRAAVTHEPQVVTLLPDKLHDFVQNWESADVRAELEAEARRLHFQMGYPEDRVLKLFQDRQGNGGGSDT